MIDQFDSRVARAAEGLLHEFNTVGVLAAADVHVARRLCALAEEADEQVALAVALAVRAPRLGHVFVDLARIASTATVESDEPVDLGELPWPDPEPWLAAVGRSPLLDGPLRLEGSALYLDRYWREEQQVARDLRAHAVAVPDAPVDGIARIFAGAEPDPDQERAVATALQRRLAVVAGGPGTGKTTTVGRIVALLLEQSPGALIALAAPTGKAAARLQQSLHQVAGELQVDEAVRTRMLQLEASTLHRLLGWRPGSRSRFRHHGGNRLPHDVVIVDETSMVSLTMMARLVEAVRPQARLILVGDPGQLTSIEAGAVLGDIVGLPEGVVELQLNHRFRGAIARFADAVRAGDVEAALRELDGPEITWIEDDPGELDAIPEVRARALATGRAVIAAARAGDARMAIDALGTFRVLCAHRRGPHGVATWMPRIESWLDVPGEPWYVGRPLLVTENDHAVRLYNGDTGVVVASASGRPVAAFERQGEIAEFAPSRLASLETVYAMTVHKAQGSQFTTAAVLLPDPGSPILTRELLYTAVTRAREHLILVGTREAITAAIERPIARASGLRDRLSPAGTP